MSMSDYLEKKMLDHAYGGPDYTRPATVYVGLSTTTPVDAGTNFTEPSGNGYARVAVTNNDTNWPAASGTTGTKANGTAITFPQSTGSWGTVTHWAIFDASTGGNMMDFSALSASKAVGSSETISFGVGSLTITAN